jgi:hypothetical protein
MPLLSLLKAQLNNQLTLTAKAPDFGRGLFRYSAEALVLVLV